MTPPTRRFKGYLPYEDRLWTASRTLTLFPEDGPRHAREMNLRKELMKI